MEYSFYSTISGNLIPAAVRLLEKIYKSGSRCIFFSPLEERVKSADKTLWTFSTNAFVPHGDKSLGFCEKQPIFFTSDISVNPNNAKVLLMLDSLDYKSGIEKYQFEKVIMMFDDPETQERSKKIFADLQKNGENVNYWKQSQKGWEKLSLETIG